MSKNKAFMFSMGLIAGVVGGIVAGVLYAPKSGEESRKELKDAACDLYEKHAPQIAEAKKQAQRYAQGEAVKAIANLKCLALVYKGLRLAAAGLTDET